MKTFSKAVTKPNIYKEYVKVINGLLMLSDREAELLALLLELNDNMPNYSELDNILSTDNRRIIMAKTRVNKNNLVKYIKTLINKGVITKANSRYKLNETMVPKITNGELNVCFRLNIIIK